MAIDNTNYVAVIHQACAMNRDLIQMLDETDMDAIVRETLKAALAGNTALITRMTDHHLEVLDMLEKLVTNLEK